MGLSHVGSNSNWPKSGARPKYKPYWAYQPTNSGVGAESPIHSIAQTISLPLYFNFSWKMERSLNFEDSF